MIPAFLRRDTLHITTLQPCTQAYVLALVARRMELARPSLVSCEVEVGEIGDCQFDQVHQGSCADCNDRAPTIQRESARSSIPSIRFGSQRAWRVVATFLSLCLHSKAIAWCSDMPFVSRKGCRRKRRSIWNLAAFVSAMAATFVLAITLHGLVSFCVSYDTVYLYTRGDSCPLHRSNEMYVSLAHSVSVLDDKDRVLVCASASASDAQTSTLPK